MKPFSLILLLTLIISCSSTPTNLEVPQGFTAEVSVEKSQKLSIYQDRYGLWHDKPTENGNPRSNNWMIYTAYAKALGLPVGDYKSYFKKCAVEISSNKILVYRHPNKPTPPLSFDEFFGITYLDKNLIPYSAIKGNHLVYVGKGKRVHEDVIFKMMKAIAEYSVAVKINRLTGKKKPDRNLWWERKLNNVRYFAARLTPAHAYILKKWNGKKPHREEEKIWTFYRDAISKSKKKGRGDISQKNFLWLLHLMNGDERRAAGLKPWVNFERYFGANHDFTKAVKRRYNIK